MVKVDKKLTLPIWKIRVIFALVCFSISFIAAESMLSCFECKPGNVTFLQVWVVLVALIFIGFSIVLVVGAYLEFEKEEED